MIKKLVWLIILSAAGAGGWYYYNQQNSDEPQYRTEKITRGNISALVSATGTINPVELVTVGSQVSGKIEKLHAKVNDHVNKQYYEVSKSNDPISSIESMANHARRTDISKPSLFGVFSKPSNWQFSIVALVFATTCIVVLAIAIRTRIKS
jgi:hypothetical protein